MTTLLYVMAAGADAFCPSMCQCDDGLLEASCSSARLDSVPILLNPSLRSLNLAHNRIASLRQSVSFYAELRRLDLSHNSLHSLGLLHFQPLGQLDWLNVSNNMISSLEVESFAGLRSLSVLDLSSNRLTRLSDGLFSELPDLVVLDLSRNKIQTIASGAFESLRRLSTLRLEDNNLNHVPSVALSALSGSLQHLHLSRNLIGTLEDGSFRELTHLRFLGLNDNVLASLHPAAFDRLDSLEVLDLSFNRLDGTLDALPTSLKHLDLSGNMWRQLPSTFLPGLIHLQTLNVSYGEYLRWVDPAAFHLVASNNNGSSGAGVLPLTNLVMTNNALWNHFSGGLLRGLESHLVRLDLSGNAFETLTVEHESDESDHWPELRYLNVAYNPLECNCSLLWLWKLLQHHHHNHSDSGLSVVNVTCSGPPPYIGLPLASLTQSELLCSMALPASIAALLVVTWLALTGGLVALVLYWRKRKRRKENSLMKSSSHHHHHHGYHLGKPPHHQPLMGEMMIPASPAPSSNLSIPHYYHGHHNHHHHHHHLAPARDEYTYHSAGTMKRIPVTVV